MKGISTFFTCLVIMLVIFVGTAQAQNGGLYGALKAGGSWINQTGPDVTDSATDPISTSTDWDDDGYVFGAAVITG